MAKRPATKEGKRAALDRDRQIYKQLMVDAAERRGMNFVEAMQHADRELAKQDKLRMDNEAEAKKIAKERRDGQRL